MAAGVSVSRDIGDVVGVWPAVLVDHECGYGRDRYPGGGRLICRAKEPLLQGESGFLQLGHYLIDVFVEIYVVHVRCVDIGRYKCEALWLEGGSKRPKEGKWIVEMLENLHAYEPFARGIGSATMSCRTT
jgi:hypothetical protein